MREDRDETSDFAGVGPRMSTVSWRRQFSQAEEIGDLG